MNTTNQVILVDSNDHEIGSMEKQEAHLKGELHRAFSVFIFNSKNELLIHRRNPEKYHSGGLWTNTCCSHPRPGEETLNAAVRRLEEEMGMVAELEEIFAFSYKAEFPNGLIEHEFDHVFVGFSDLPPTPDTKEADAWCYVNSSTLLRDVESRPERYTPWFKICLEKVLSNVSKQ